MIFLSSALSVTDSQTVGLFLSYRMRAVCSLKSGLHTGDQQDMGGAINVSQKSYCNAKKKAQNTESYKRPGKK